MAASGTWKVSQNYKQLLVDGTSPHRYRVCSALASGYKAELTVDGKVVSPPLLPGECRDVTAKTLEVHLAGGSSTATASGIYDNLD